MKRIPAKTLLTALRGYYAPAAPARSSIDAAELVGLLRNLPSLSAQAHNQTILSQLETHHPGLAVSVEDQALLMYIDDVLGSVLKTTDMEFRVEAVVRNLAPLVGAVALEKDIHELLKPQKIYTLLDKLTQYCIGWSEDLGTLGEKFIEKLEAEIRPFSRQKIDLETCLTNLDKALKSELHRQKKLEENLTATETEHLQADSARFATAEMLNQKMAGQMLPMFILFMLQGAWYEFAQKAFLKFGTDSPEWQELSELTADLVWSLQAQPQAAKQQKLFVSLPKQINKFADDAGLQSVELSQCLADVTAEYEAIDKNEPSPSCDFDPLETPQANTGQDQSLNTPVTPGEWYLYDDKKESEEKVARIRLIIDDPHSKILVFTNQNRRKVMRMSYREFTARLSDTTVKPLSIKFPLHELSEQHLETVITAIKEQKAKELREEEAQRRKQISKEFLSDRKELISLEMAKLKQRALAKQRRANLLRQKAAKKLEAAETAVKNLKQDAWVNLPIMEGTLTPCKLVAVVAAADKYIFANRAGIKVAEYSAAQLSHLIVTENSEILDTGAEFENVLASVVTGLRENKEKSFDQLTGSA